MREKQEQRKRVTEDSIAIKMTQKKWERRGKPGIVSLLTEETKLE